MTDQTGIPPTGAVPISSKRPGWREVLGALRIYNYRLYAMGQLASTTAVWMQRIAQDWLVLELTGSVTAVGFMVVMQFGPILFLGMWGGVIVDRYSKRTMITIAQLAVAAIGATLAVLAFAQTVQAWHVYLLAGILGLVSVVDQPARQVFVSELVGRDVLRNAISTNSAIFQTAGMIGPAVSGVLIVSVGNAWAFTAAVIGCLLSLATLFALDSSSLHRTPPTPRAKGQVGEALRYARRKPAIFWTLLLLTFVSGIGLNWPVLLAAMADQVFTSGAAGYGAYNSAIAVGALAGAILSMRRRTVRLRTFVFAVAAMTIFKLVAGLAPTEALLVGLLALAGMFGVLMWTAANSLLQLSSNMAIRGRIMSLYLLIASGGQAVGGPILGFLCDQLGARTGMVLSASVPLFAALIIAGVLAHFGRLKLRFSVRREDPLLRIVDR